MWRWPWRSPRTVQRSAAPDATPDTGSTTDHPAKRSEPPAWQSLPPIQRITPDEPRLNLPEAFTGTLASWRDPSYLAPLGHLVSGAEPAGVLHGAAEPVTAPAEPSPVGQPAAQETAPMPLATPAAPAPHRTAALQRSVTGIPHDPAPASPHFPGPASPHSFGPATSPDPVTSKSGPVTSHEPGPTSGYDPGPTTPQTLRLPPGQMPEPGQLPPGQMPEPGPMPELPLATPTRPVPLEPVSVSQLLTAPPPPVQLHLPTVSPPSTVAQRSVAPSTPEPTDVEQPASEELGSPDVPTLGREPLDPALFAGESSVHDPGHSASADVVAPSRASSGPPLDLAVQRSLPEVARPTRRLGLGEPIVSPLLPPRDATPAPDAMQRVPAGDSPSPPPLVHRPVTASQPTTSPSTTSQPTTSPSTTSQPTTSPTTTSQPTTSPGDDDRGVTESSASTGEQAGLIGETSVSRLAADASPGSPGSPGSPESSESSESSERSGLFSADVGLDTDAGTRTGTGDGSPTSIGDLPVVGAPGSRSTPDGGPPSGGGGSPTTVQTFVSPDGPLPAEAQVTPLLGQPSVARPTNDEPPPRIGPPGPADLTGGATDPGVGRSAGSADLPVVSRLAMPGSTADAPVRAAGSATQAPPAGSATQAPPATFDGDAAAAAGTDASTGGSDPPDAGSDTAGLVGGYGEPPDQPDGSSGQPDSAPAALPLVVARLVGDRPIRSLAGELPEPAAPAGPSVQRVSWQHHEARPDSGPLTYAGPEHSPPRTEARLPAVVGGSAPREAGGGPPVQRWVGALPGSPPSSGRSGSGGGNTPVSGDNPPVTSLTNSGGGSTPMTFFTSAGDGGAPMTYLVSSGAGGTAAAYSDGSVGSLPVQRAEPTAVPPDDPPPTDLPPPELPAAPPATAPTPPAGDATAAGQPATPGAPGAATEPEELLKKLYDPLLRRLKTELRLDRERHGVLGGPG